MNRGDSFSLAHEQRSYAMKEHFTSHDCCKPTYKKVSGK